MYRYPITLDFKSEAFSSYYIFSQIAYYCLISPYRTHIVTDLDSNLRLEVTRNIIQRILCAIMHFLIVLLSFLGAILAIFGNRPSIKHNPTMVYDIAKALSFCIGNLIFIHMVRFKKHGLLYLYQSCFEMAPRLKPYSPKAARKIWALLLLIIFLCTVTFVLGAEVGKDVGFAKLLTISKHKLGLSGIADSDPILNAIISSMIAFIFIYRNFLMYFTGILLPVTSSVCILESSQDFWQILKENPDMEFDQVLVLFSTVKKFVSTFNQVLRFHMLLWIITGITNFTSSIFIILDHENPLVRLLYALFCSCFTIGIGIAAEATAKFQKFSEYLYKNIEKPSYSNTIGSLLAIQDSVMRPIGLTAHGFPITYHLVFTIFSGMMTYGTILLQFKVAVRDVN